MSCVKDPLVHLPKEQWSDLQEVFKSDWPKGISGYTVLETQKQWLKRGYDYGFKVFCPFGEVWNGMVAVNQKNISYEIIIQCPNEDTIKLEEALKTTKEINWKRNIVIPFAPTHVIESVKRIVEYVPAKVELILPSESFFLEKGTSIFNVSLQQDLKFDLLTAENVEFVNSCWPHRYPGSEWYFDLLIKTNSGFGIFRQQTLISWVFVNEAGTLGHMCTVEQERRKGYGELVLKLVCNKLLKEGKDVFAFAVKGNQGACDLYRKVGFKNFDGVAWCFLKGK